MGGSEVFYIGPMGFAAIVATFFGLMAAVVWAAVRFNRARRRGMASFARCRGFAYQQHLPGGRRPAFDLHERLYASESARTYLLQFGDCPLFNAGTWRNVSNVMSGTAGNCECAIFDYSHWTEARGQAEHEIVQVTCVALFAERSLGRFSVEPRLPLLGPLMAAAKPGDIVCTGYGDFDAKFIVRSVDPVAAQRHLTGPLRACLLSLEQGRNRYYRQLHVHDRAVVVSEISAPARHLPVMIEIAQAVHDAIQRIR
ncbi:MAG: hypothetical protein JXR94_06225 [Candidatus Hydrogenedentes bacterium]|nr:hypothetical protein [Candidatus Hydrogenedentota bacterium]